MKKLIVSLLSLLILSSCWADDVPPVVKSGFQSYIEKDLAAAFDVWMRGSALEGDKTSRLQLVGGLTQIESAYGKPQSYEVLASYDVSKRLKRIYAVSYHPKGPLFSYFDLFHTDSGEWVLYMFYFNTKPQEILPRELIDKKG